MKATWLGGSGLLFENSKARIFVDPSFTEEVDGRSRLIPMDEKYAECTPSLIIITHAHPESLDTATLDKLLSLADSPVTLLVSESAYEIIAKRYPSHNTVLLSPHSVWNEKGVTFYSVKAEHSDRSAIGVILDDAEKTYYVTGDTLYNFDVIDDCLDLAPDGVDYVFLPISGKACCMNARDAADFAYEIGADKAVPIGYGTYDSSTADDFDFEDAIIVPPYREIEL
jgi:L-ascorbate metabolism protein UlaG (beta-lactamase superfamily)